MFSIAPTARARSPRWSCVGLGDQVSTRIRVWRIAYTGVTSREVEEERVRSPVIAIVNDDREVVMLLTALLRRSGYRTVQYDQRSGVVGLVRQTRPDLLILDINMEYPDSGWQVLDELRHDPATELLPVLIYSVMPHVAERVRARRDPACAMLPLGTDMNTFLTTIRQWVPIGGAVG